MEEHFIIEEVSLEFMIDDKVMTVHAETKQGIKAVTDCKIITVGCAV